MGGERRRLRAVPPPRLRVADVALFYGERSGGIRTYLDAKRPGPREGRHRAPRHRARPRRAPRDRRHELPSLRFAAPNGYRLPLGAGALKETLRELRPDVVLLHDPFWARSRRPRRARARRARRRRAPRLGRRSTRPGCRAPTAWQPLLRALDPPRLRRRRRGHVRRRPARGRRPGGGDRRCASAWIPPSARSRDVRRGDHVLYVGRLAREKGVFELLEAARARASRGRCGSWARRRSRQRCGALAAARDRRARSLSSRSSRDRDAARARLRRRARRRHARRARDVRPRRLRGRRQRRARRHLRDRAVGARDRRPGAHLRARRHRRAAARRSSGARRAARPTPPPPRSRRADLGRGFEAETARSSALAPARRRRVA